MNGICYGEKVTIKDEDFKTYTVIYEDGVEEVVEKELVEIVKFYKTPKPLKRGKPMKRGSVKKVNPARKKKMYKRNFGSEERVKAIKEMSCTVHGCYSRNIVNAHILESRGAGGDYTGILPLCVNHHDEEHSIGTSVFIEKYSINVQEEIRKVRGQLGEL